MDKNKAKAAIEAILFTMGESVEISRLAAVLEMDKQEVTALLKEMDKDYRKENRGIFLMWLEDSVQLSTKADLYEYLIKIAKTPRKMVLTDTVIETLSIIAYKQPVTRLEIEKIRGVSCDHAINKLLEYEAGKKGCTGTSPVIWHYRTVFTLLRREVHRRTAGTVSGTGRGIQTTGRGGSRHPGGGHHCGECTGRKRIEKVSGMGM